MFVIKYVSTNYPLFLTHVCVSVICVKCVIADKRATVQPTVATNTFASLFSWSKTHELSVLHALECEADSERCEKKKLANLSRVNCLFEMIGQ